MKIRIFTIFFLFTVLAYPVLGLENSMTRAEDARKRAVDFDVPAYFPSEWEAAEALYTAAGILPRTTQNQIQQAIISFNAAADTYDSLFARTVPLYAQAREDEIMFARSELIRTSLTRSYPEALWIADEAALAAYDQFLAGDYYRAKTTAADALGKYEDMLFGTMIYFTREELVRTGLMDLYPEALDGADDMSLAAIDQYLAERYFQARITAAEALNEYDTLLFATDTYFVREEIVDRGFEIYDPLNFMKADIFALAAVDYYEAGNRSSALANAEDARLLYNTVLSNGWAAYAADRGSYAAIERHHALTERVNIASRDHFREAEAAYNEAIDMFVAENYHDAAYLFMNAETHFYIARMETEVKRHNAADALFTASAFTGDSNNANFAESRRLTRLAQETFSLGEYDVSIEFAEEAVRLARLSGAAVDSNAADVRLAFESTGTPVSPGTSSFLPGTTSTSPSGASPSGTLPSGTSPLPSQYTVRSWGTYLDCLWTIAGYPWVYGDPERWGVLYEANRSRMPEPDNPHLIEPGMIIEIPSIRGEFRQGMWDPNRTYTAP